MYKLIFAISSFKLLLLPSYHSTDFEVHRNWLAITNGLLVKEWYINETSQWTLDYPPFFAWFEWILSQIAYLFDPKMLIVSNLNYASKETILFQRLTVIITDFLFAYSISECIKEIKKSMGKKSSFDYLGLFLIIFANAGMILVDHIHFQYNGFLYGIMFLSIARILQSREIEGAFWFAVLLNLKHIYLYIAPAFFVYLFRSFCFSSNKNGSIKWNSLSITNFAKLGTVVLIVFLFSLGPFIAIGQLNQVLRRLFPFKRGLSHAYWAPNFWALYNFLDKVLTFVAAKMKLIDKLPEGSMTSGLVQEYNHNILPSITPLATFIITFVFMLPCLFALWKTPHDRWQFIRAITMCGFCSFLFGWHVHEKAILLVILPLGLLCHLREIEARLFLFLSLVGHFSLFPLIFTHHETVIKVMCLLLHAYFTSIYLNHMWNKSKQKVARGLLLSTLEKMYLIMLVPLFLYEQVFNRILGLDNRYPFLPIMLISVYCSIGVIYTWFQFYYVILFTSVKNKIL